jgi:hypothetical protein
MQEGKSIMKERSEAKETPEAETPEETPEED